MIIWTSNWYPINRLYVPNLAFLWAYILVLEACFILLYYMYDFHNFFIGLGGFFQGKCIFWYTIIHLALYIWAYTSMNEYHNGHPINRLYSRAGLCLWKHILVIEGSFKCYIDMTSFISSLLNWLLNYIAYALSK